MLRRHSNICTSGHSYIPFPVLLQIIETPNGMSFRNSQWNIQKLPMEHHSETPNGILFIQLGILE